MTGDETTLRRRAATVECAECANVLPQSGPRFRCVASCCAGTDVPDNVEPLCEACSTEHVVQGLLDAHGLRHGTSSRHRDYVYVMAKMKRWRM